eukprot:CAMPEP_0170178120 /NCGR_PEP_ID=MMETSP0040_2-20121228/11677_1 /TAXON_ID=641309 /ORGANISM="Lotharella oceanica, Strain CCMP622" /LENGTH=190 /DNA_ID=CAMNT_0010421085 /DNA_START=24 /DNA_END=596 /DNA_ORIENTATION=-
MEVQQIVRERSGASTWLQCAIGFVVGIIGVVAIASLLGARADSQAPELGVGMTLARNPAGSIAAMRPSLSGAERDAWVADVRLRKRDRQAEKSRMHNKAIRSAVRTRTKKALRAIEENKKAGISSESDLQATDKLISEAYKEIDKSVQKGIFKQNTGARQKSRIATWRKKLLIESGLYTPAEAVEAQATA